ncbi:MAG: hypothetical protein R2828_17730 [Saprospiraceae bacterium]
MNLQQAKILLEKINSLYKSISMDEGEMASIERDLMLSYIRQLYETFRQLNPEEGLNRDNNQAAKVKQNPNLEITNEAAIIPPVRKYTPPKIIEIPDTPKESPAPLRKETPLPPVAAAPTPVPAPAVQMPPPPPIDTPAPSPKPAPASKSTRSINPKVKALFVYKEAKELSEKLSSQPIKDLTRSMAINDRLLYENDLFNKSKDALNEALKQLNSLSSMDEAQPLLEDFALENDWVNEEKADTAIAFIKLVRRRYL